MCPSRASSPPKEAAPLVDNSHNEETGLSILSIHTESVFGTLSVVGVIIALVLMAVCIYRHYIKKMMRGTQAMVAASASGGSPPSCAPPIQYTPRVEYHPVRNSSVPALMMEGLEMRLPVRHLSRDQHEDISRVVRQCSNN